MMKMEKNWGVRIADVKWLNAKKKLKLLAIVDFA